MNVNEARSILLKNNFPIDDFSDEQINQIILTSNQENITINELININYLLEQAFDSDQAIRSETPPKDINSLEYAKFMQKMGEIDDKNLRIVTKIIDKYGFINRQILTPKASWILFGALQHADRHVDVQLYYLPILRNAVNNGKVFKQHLAYLEDRIATNLGAKQIYGTQMRPPQIIPVLDVENINNFRLIMDLQPLKEYINDFCKNTNTFIDPNSLYCPIINNYSTQPIDTVPDIPKSNMTVQEFYDFVSEDLKSRGIGKLEEHLKR